MDKRSPASNAQDQEIFLRPDWDSTITSNTYFIRYQLVNRSMSPIYPTRDNFSGILEEWEGGKWVHIVGGVSCVSGMEWLPIAPGALRQSAPYSVHPMILERGRYRYRVEYSRDSFESGEWSIRYASAEFEIE